MEFLIVPLIIIAVLVLWGFSIYNGFVRSRNLIQESWRQIDVELNRRYELIPNLVETVRGYAAHERNTLEEVTRLRNQAAALANQTHGEATEQRAQIEQQLSGAVRNLIVAVEAYPDLKSNVNFLELQRELTDTEDRIAAGRRFYNANVRDYNTKVESVPSNIVANFAKFEKATYFEVNDAAVRQAPSVSFGEISQRPGGAPDSGNQLPDPNAYRQQAPTQAPPQQSQPPQQPQYQPPAAPQGYQSPQSGYAPPPAEPASYQPPTGSGYTAPATQQQSYQPPATSGVTPPVEQQGSQPPAQGGYPPPESDRPQPPSGYTPPVTS